MASKYLTSLGTSAALLTLCVAALLYAKWVPFPVPATASPSEFSAERAMRHVEAIARAPHPSGNEVHARVREYLHAELRALGLTPQEQHTTGIGTRYAVAGRVRNVLARIPGRTSGRLAVLLMAHYDGVPAGPAAGDDASGTAVVLETLRALRAQPPLEHDVIALVTDGEEPGLLGAAAFVREHPWAKDVGVVLNFEARGTRGPSFMFETGLGNLDVVRVLRVVRGVRATSLSTAVYRRLPNDTDLSELAILEKPAMNFAFIEGVDRYHTAEDDVAHLSRSSVQHHGDQALALARAFGNGPLPRPRTPDAVFFNVPVLGLIVYPESWALPIALVPLLLVVVALARFRARGQRWLRDTTLGVLACLLGPILAAFIGFFIGAGLQRLHAALRGGGSPEWSGIYALALTLLAFAVGTSCWSVLRRWTSASALYVGALLGASLLSLFVAWLAPAMAFLFTCPVLGAALAAPALVVPERQRIARVLIWVGALVVVFVVLPTVYLMVCSALGLNETGAAVLALFASFGALLLAPLIEVVNGTRRWTTPAVAGASALVLFIVGAITVRTDAEHPVGASISYVVDSDSGKAWLTGGGSNASSAAWMRRQLLAMAPRAPVPAWLARASGSPTLITAPSFYGVPTPATSIVSDSTVADSRRVTVHVRPARGTRAISMAVDSGLVLSAAVDGRAVPTERYRRRAPFWTLDYFAPSDSGFTLALVLRPSVPTELGLLARFDGIPPMSGLRLPPRPPGILRIQSDGQSLVYRRIKL